MGKKDGRAHHLFLYGWRLQVAAGPNDGATLCSPCPRRDRHDKRLSRYQIDSARAAVGWGDGGRGVSGLLSSLSTLVYLHRPPEGYSIKLVVNENCIFRAAFNENLFVVLIENYS